jgi:para-aminobenzoate synthetase
MKVLIINNHTKHLDELIALFSNPIIIDKENLKNDIDLTPYDLVVISGGSGVSSVVDYPEDYLIESDLIKNTTIPVLGICLGSEIITHAFGGTLQKSDTPHKGVIKLTLMDNNLKKILEKDFVEVHEAHRVYIKDMPKDFTICATSDHGIEIIKHTTKPILGIQFHPEISKNEAVFKWIFETVGLKQVNLS